MKKIVFFSTCLISFIATSQQQTIFAFTDINRYFHSFKDGYFNQIDNLDVNSVVMGDEVIAYYNVQQDFKIFNGTTARLITNQSVEFKSSDHMAAWNLGPLLYYYENGKPYNLTSFGKNYWVSDSLITFQDTRFNSLNVVYKGKITPLVQSTTELPSPIVQGDNLVVFKDNGDIYKVFYRGNIYDIGAYNGTEYKFFAGTDILGFNDPQSRTFAVFQNGEFADLEEFHTPKAKAGRGFLVYEDLQGNLKYFGNNEVKTISSYPQFWDAKDDIALWGDATNTYQIVKGEKKTVAGFLVKDWKLKNDVVAYRTQVGGVAASVNGYNKEITTIYDAEYVVNGHGVMVKLPNNAVIILYNNQLYRY